MTKRKLIILLLLINFAFLVNPYHGLASTPSSAINSTSTSIDDPIYKRSLEALQKTVPLPYNMYVRKQITAYTKHHKSRFSKMLGLSKYYFPIYEKVFKEHKVPEEIKYLSIVESSLDPHAVSSYGATGPWQFLYEYGKLYGLTINDSIDERKDPLLASHAAARYLLDSYEMYGDWLLAIASYNCGRNNIKWAMEKNPGATDYWSLRQYLPEETQNYIPAYIATVYLMNNYRKHGISASSAGFNVNTEIIQLNKPIPLEAVARQLKMDMNVLYRLNPSYIKQIINGSPQKTKPLVIPVLPTFSYNNLCAFLGIPGRKTAQSTMQPIKTAKYFITYRVQDGDTFDLIARKFKGLTAEDIKRTNRVSDESIKAGMLLKIMKY